MMIFRLQECFAPYNIALGLRRNSPLKRRVDEVIGRINQAGLVRHYFLQSLRMAVTSKEYGSEDKLTNEEDDGITPLKLDHLQGAFIICSLGLLFAAVSYLFELTICG
ncbi:hypothetical protein Pcinc_003692 [Petrolisthes cinctipes]|uniref:Uncharacterized protein n=1 Tax=Petrolisthes cinctipes TaxID=88211 RepID=A0AAE1GIU5_PETCI|nr:hypothetical protein Pcinc_003692 [Petrolisthes cinctipes]